MSRFGKVVTAMATPFAKDGSLDLDGAAKLASWLVENGSDAIVAAGSTGEAPTLTKPERLELFKVVGDAIRGKGQLICGTGTYSTAESIELTRAAEEIGADGVLIVTPYYNKPPQRGLIAHFEAVADATSLPVITYNIPGRTGTRIEHETLLALANKPNIVAVKDSTGDFQAISKLIAEAPEGFEVYSGDDWATFGYSCMGAAGVISVASHLVGTQMREMIDLVEAGDIDGARKIHEKISPVFDVLFITSNPIPLKAALTMMGLPAGSPRLPLLPATDAEVARVRGVMEGAGLL